MNAGVAGRVLGLPLDRLIALYIGVAAIALVFPHRPEFWPALLALHVTLMVVAWPAPFVERLVERASPRTRATIRLIADWAPLVMVPLLYKELAVLNRSVHDGFYFDDIIIRIEQLAFSGQPSREWAAALPHLWLSELLHAAYMSYYFIIFVLPVVLFFNVTRPQFRVALFTLMLGFFSHYVFFIYLPVQGPRYLFPAPSGEIATGFVYQLTHRALEAGSSQGAAFPSSHVGVSVVQVLIMWRYLPRLAAFTALLTLGLAIGAVYGGFHYATDALLGAALGVGAFMAGRPLYDWFARDRSK